MRMSDPGSKQYQGWIDCLILIYPAVIFVFLFSTLKNCFVQYGTTVEWTEAFLCFFFTYYKIYGYIKKDGCCGIKKYI